MGAPKILAMILAGGRVGELSVLTLRRPKSAVPFGGVYRVIDCAMTNLIDSNIEHVGILSQYRPLSLMRHIGSAEPWDLIGYRRGVRFLPPHTGIKDSDWYKGTADALYQNITFIESHNPDWVLIVSGDHIYRMNYDALFEMHARTGAEATIAVTPVEFSQAQRFGLVKLDNDGRVKDYQEKPAKPISNLASMTVYVFRTEVLIKELINNAASGHTFQIYDEILPHLVERQAVYAHIFTGYWSYSRTIRHYFQANMSCLGPYPAIDLARWQLHTRIEGKRVGDPPPMLAGSNSEVKNSVVSPGTEIHGRVGNSVLSPMCVIEPGARVENSVLFEGVKVEAESQIMNAIIDKDVIVGKGSVIGGKDGVGARPNITLGKLLDNGISVIGKKCIIPERSIIGRNVLIYPEASDPALYRNGVNDGMTIGTES